MEYEEWERGVPVEDYQSPAYPFCIHCPKLLVQAQDGTWVDIQRGNNICIYNDGLANTQTVFHTPMPQI